MNHNNVSSESHFLLSKATFSKTAIKPKIVHRFFFLINSTATIDQCSIKPPSFGSIENSRHKMRIFLVLAFVLLHECTRIPQVGLYALIRVQGPVSRKSR